MGELAGCTSLCEAFRTRAGRVLSRAPGTGKLPAKGSGPRETGGAPTASLAWIAHQLNCGPSYRDEKRGWERKSPRTQDSLGTEWGEITFFASQQTSLPHVNCSDTSRSGQPDTGCWESKS